MTTVQKNEPSFTDEQISIKVLPDNIEEMLDVPDAQFLLVIDKNYRMYVFTNPQMEHEVDTIDENAARHENRGASPPRAMNVRHGMMHAHQGGRDSWEIKHESDGCFWYIKGQRNDDGSLIESNRVCIGMRGCPVGKTIP